MASDPLEGPKVKIERAKTHIESFHRILQAWIGSRPHEFVTENEPDGRHKSRKLKLVKPIPPEAAAIAGDAVHNIRTALDHLACCLALAAGATKISDVYFPTGRDANKFKANAKEKTKLLSPEARTMVTQLEVYPEGNGAILFSLHELDVMDKHQLLIPVGIVSTQVRIEHMILPPGSTPGRTLGPWSEEGTTLATIPIEAQFNHRIGVQTNIAFRDVRAIELQPALAVLQQMLHASAGVIAMFEERFFK